MEELQVPLTDGSKVLPCEPLEDESDAELDFYKDQLALCFDPLVAPRTKRTILDAIGGVCQTNQDGMSEHD